MNNDFLRWKDILKIIRNLAFWVLVVILVWVIKIIGEPKTGNLNHEETRPHFLNIPSESYKPYFHSPSSEENEKKANLPPQDKTDLSRITKKQVEKEVKDWEIMLKLFPIIPLQSTPTKGTYRLSLNGKEYLLQIPKPELYIRKLESGGIGVKYLLRDNNTLQIFPLRPYDPPLLYKLFSLDDISNLCKQLLTQRNEQLAFPPGNSAKSISPPFLPSSPNFQVPSPPVGRNEFPLTYFAIGSGHWVSNNFDGKYIELEDGSLWEISDYDQVDTQMWQDMDDIVVAESNNPFYPYLLINTSDRTKAEAKLVKF